MIIRSFFLLAVVVSLSSFTARRNLEANAAEQAVESSWPKLIENDQGSVLVHQPKIESLSRGTLTASSTLVLNGSEEGESIFGTAFFRAQANVNEATQTALIDNITIENLDFPDSESTNYARRVIGQALQGAQADIPLDRLESGVKLAQLQAGQESSANYNTTPPIIYVETKPALLVLIDGEPKLAPLEDNSVMRVINTAFDILLFSDTGTYYLRVGNKWFVSNAIYGPWRQSDSVPRPISQEVSKSQRNSADSNADVIPDGAIIIVSTDPAALVQLDGDIELSPIERTDLLYVSNTPSDLFFDVGTQSYYLLLAGRWYKTDRIETLADWRFVESDDLPNSFANIPADSPMDYILASVAGTAQAQEAVIEAQTPYTATVDRNTASLDVSYAGEPQFEPIAGTRLTYAANTNYSVLEYAGSYYACQDGVWFFASSPYGPWSVATYVPDEIYKIPSTHPLYPVTFVYVGGSDPDYVYTSYTPGYTGSYVSNGTVVYGTGWSYAPYYWHSYNPYYGGYYYAGFPIFPGFGFYLDSLFFSWPYYFSHRYHWYDYGHYWHSHYYGYDYYYGYRDRPVRRAHVRHNRDHDFRKRNIYNRWESGRIADRSWRERTVSRLSDAESPRVRQRRERTALDRSRTRREATRTLTEQSTISTRQIRSRTRNQRGTSRERMRQSNTRQTAASRQLRQNTDTTRFEGARNRRETFRGNTNRRSATRTSRTTTQESRGGRWATSNAPTTRSTTTNRRTRNSVASTNSRRETTATRNNRSTTRTRSAPTRATRTRSTSRSVAAPTRNTRSNRSATASTSRRTPDRASRAPSSSRSVAPTRSNRSAAPTRSSPPRQAQSSTSSRSSSPPPRSSSNNRSSSKSENNESKSRSSGRNRSRRR